jgi:hypothetical protein
MIEERIIPYGLEPVTSIIDETVAAAKTYMLRGFVYSIHGMHKHACGCQLKAAKKYRRAKRLVAMERFWGFRG